MSSEVSQDVSLTVAPPPTENTSVSPSPMDLQDSSPLPNPVLRRHTGKARTAIMDLTARLYDKPENSQALLAIRQQEKLRQPLKGSPSPTGQPLVPRPPLGRAPAPGTAFRTTMFKKDFERKQLRKKKELEPPLNLNRLVRRPSLESLASLPRPLKEPTPTPSNHDSLASVEVHSVPSHVFEPIKKSVHFQPTEVSSGPSPDELPSFAPTPVEGTPEPTAPSVISEPEILPPPPPVAVMEPPPSSKPSSRQLDPNLVLGYLRKNVYDDTDCESVGSDSVASSMSLEVPENANFVESVVAMRKALGWVVEIPRHGPGCRKALDDLKDKPEVNEENSKQPNGEVKDDDGSFIYALPRNRKDRRGRYNPYELQVVSAHLARSQPRYWTASATSITTVSQTEIGEYSEQTPVLQWLWERRLYHNIYNLPVFIKFKKWKAFTMWKNNVCNNKNTSSRLVLTRTLFTANEILQGCLLHVRQLCESASSSLTGFGDELSSIQLFRFDSCKTFTLDKFIKLQQEQAETALEQIMSLRRKVVDLVWESCVTVAEMEGVTHGIRPNSEGPGGVIEKLPLEEAQEEDSRTMQAKKKKASRLEQKYQMPPSTPQPAAAPAPPKKSRPSYAQIAEWRKILHRLSYFLRLIDYVVMEMLKRLVTTATRELMHFISSSNDAGKNLELDDEMLSNDSDAESEDSLAVARMSETSSSARVRKPKDKPKGILGGKEYVIPKFDFDKPEEVEKMVDIDEILQELDQQERVTEVIQPVLSIQLVLNVPELATSSSAHSGKRRNSRRLSVVPFDDSRPRRRSLIHSALEVKKAVKFTDEQESSDDSDYEDDEDDDETGTGNESSHQFAYPPAERRLAGGIPRAHVSLCPSENQVQEGVRAIISDFEATVTQYSSLLQESRLAPFYSSHKYDLKLHYDLEVDDEEAEETIPWPDALQLFGEDPEYQALLENIMEIIMQNMNDVKQYIENFHVYCEMVDKAQRIDVDSSMDKRQWSTDEFQQVLAVHTDQLTRMESMHRAQRLGLIHVMSENFYQSCVPYPSNVMMSVVNKLPLIALKRNEDLLTIIKGASQKLDKFPNSVEEFVDHLSFLGKMSSEMPALEKEYAIVTKLYTIARDFDVIIPPEELALYQTLAPSFQHLKSTILYAEAKKDDNIRKFSTDLDTLIHDIRYKIMDIKSRVQDPSLLHGDTMAVVVLDKVNMLTEEVTSLSTKARSYANYQERFGSSLNNAKKNFSEEFMMMDRKESDASAQEIQADLSEIERDLTLRRLLWESQEEWDRLAQEWTSNPFDVLNVEALQKNVNRFTQTVYMLEKGLPGNEVVPRLKEKVMNFKLVMPCITSLRNPSLKTRHWDQIERIIGRQIVRDKAFTLGNLLEMNIIKHKDKIQDISTTASNEATLERMLQKVIDLWKVTDFRLVDHVNVHIISGADDILALLEESQVTVGTIRGSRYVTPIKGLVEEWERKLALFSRTMDEWMTCQRNWLYLEQIFTTPDIQRQLPNESKLFAGVDKAWKDIMRRTEDRPNALRSATAPGVLEMLQSANASLEKIQKCLEDYLETKRLVFPRFYFLSNDDLLDILAQSKNPDSVQPHLGKCFGNIRSLEIKLLPRQPPTVRTITSAEGETISMPKNVRARGPVEQWLGSVEMGMFDTVKKHLKLGLQDWVGIPMEEWVLRHPGQVVLTVSQIQFNKEVVACFLASDPVKELAGIRDKMIRLLSMLANLVSSNLSPHKRQSINALLTIDVHTRDIINSMVENKISRRDDFEFTRQLRYEWDEQSNNCNVLQSNAIFTYGYEYLGCSPRLVITPLTDRCYLTLTGALHLHLGGSPAGPAGTGKTETVKDLAKALGKQCVVFNCSEGLDYKMLGRFFSGMAQSGSWCCFDEFNRIDLEVLSVVAQQIHTIKVAKDQNAPRFVFEGRDIRLNTTCGYSITMNPSYAGRVDLPDNLKSLFRPVAMMVPDYALIAEIMLFSEGFTAAKSLSTKIVNLYQLISKQLSQQHHYDFGMRAIKSVLVMAGQRKRTVQLSDTGRIREISQDEEGYILIHALRDANMPKFLAEDVPLFESILEDLFPGVTLPQQDQGVLEKAISMSIRDLSMQHWPSQIEKVKQLHSQILVRHGVMLVGPTGGGKTTSRHILQRALALLPTLSMEDVEGTPHGAPRKSVCVGRPGKSNRSRKGHVETVTINPKCVTMGELYGETDPLTFEWTDGLIAMATRKFSRDALIGSPEDHARTNSELTTASKTAANGMLSVAGSVSPGPAAASPVPSGSEIGDIASEVASNAGSSSSNKESGDSSIDTIPIDWKWIILDGPVDTIWVENLNTVLDDSKILCLANGERISLTPGMRLLFEVDDLSKASPATVSRCAMVYMDPVELGWRPYIRTWMQRLPREMPESGKQHLQALLDHAVEKGLKFVRTYSKHQMLPTPEMSIIMCFCNIFNAFLDFMAKNGGFGNPDKEPARPESAGSESSHSRSSSRTDVRKQRRTTKKQAKLKDELQTIAEKAATKLASTAREGKQYFLQRNPTALPVILGKLFVFAFTWSFGGNFKRQDELEDDGGIGRKTGGRSDLVDVDIATEFDNFVHETFEVEPPLGVRMPASSRTIYSYFVDMDSGNFLTWDALVSSTQSLIERGAVITIGETMGVSSDTSQNKSQEGEIVTTVDTVRYSFLMALLLLNKNPVLLTGESGVGKTAIIKHTLKRLEREAGMSYKSGTILGDIFNFSDKNAALLNNISSLTRGSEDDGDKTLDMLLGGGKIKQQGGIVTSTLQFSAQTTSWRTQLALTHKLIKKGREAMGAPKGKKVLAFMDDLNMPAPEQYGAQPPLELLRQFLDQNGFYDTKKLTWKNIHDVTLLAACGPPGGGRNNVSPRMLKHFCMLALPQPSTRSLQHIYQVQLGRFFQEGDYMPEVKECLFPLVSAAIAIYYRMISIMRPTPAKIHYTFNIRDLSAVITGLLQAEESVIVNSDNCAQLFAHEATRVFHDRLVDETDRQTFYEMLADNLHDYFKVKWTPEKLMAEPVLFADFLDMQESRRVYRPSQDRARLTSILEEYYMRQNIGNTQAPQLVFFKDAVEHILRAARVFRQPGGHMMMVGLDGTGKSTTVQLATYIANCELYKLLLTRGYNIQDFREDLKKVCQMGGVQGVNTVFLLTDGDIVKESFLEDVNCILNSGEVPDLFDNEEIDGIAMELKSAAAEAQIPDTRSDVYNFFIGRVKKNLHIVLTMSPAGNKFRQRCRMNPSLINCCTIDWFDEWNREASLSVAEVYFQNADFMCEEGQDVEALKTKVAEMCVDIHQDVSKATHQFWEEMRRRFYITPSSYMELIRIYSRMLDEKKTEFMNNKHRLLVGLSRLSEANSLVGTMQEELVQLGPKIEEKRRDTEMLLEQLGKDQEAVDQVREIVEAEENVMKRETQAVQDYADECQRDLVSVLPVLQQAIESLDSLDKADIAELRVYMSPPQLVKIVMSAVCILLQKKPDWATAKQVLADHQFLNRLSSFDKNTVPEKVFQKLKKYSQHPDFHPEKVGKVSKACESMCQWVTALENYHEVYKMAKPKQKRVEEAKEALKLAQDSLAQKQASLGKIQEHLSMLQQQYQDSVGQREGLKERKVLTGLRLERASILITALSDEKVRWSEAVDELDFKLRGLVGDMLVSAAAVAYLGAFTSKYRRELITLWKTNCQEGEIPISHGYEFVKSMASPNQILLWHNEGLPQDTHSTENAIVVKKARKWPLLIDPQGQASKWIHEMEGSKLKVVKASDPNYMQTMERAIRVGDPVLLQDVMEDLDPSLNPILLQETTIRGAHYIIKLGDTEIEYNHNFRLYLTTAMGNPHFLPVVCINVTVINFTVTFEGLQEQLLSSVVKQERPMLEKERSQLLNNIASDIQFLRDLEDKTLELLQKSDGHILDDKDLVETLQKSKGMSEEIHKRLSQSEEAEKKLNLARKRYLPVATRGAVLYFVLADLANVDVMYQFSLPWFQSMFITAINLNQDTHRPTHHYSSSMAMSRMSGTMRRASLATPRSPEPSEPPTTPTDLNAHMLKMIERLTWNIYRIVSVALFANHQLMFSFMLCSYIMKSNYDYSESDIHSIGRVSPAEWTTFLQGSVMASMLDPADLAEHDGLNPMQRLEFSNRGEDPPRPEWLTDRMWQQCQHLELTFPPFDLLCRSILSCPQQWQDFLRDENPYQLMKKPWQPKADLPAAQEGSEEYPLEPVTFAWEKLSQFQHVLLVKVLRLSNLTDCVRIFVEEQMSKKFISSGGTDLKEMFEESNAKTPLIFILSPGSDPGTQLLRFAKELRGSTLHLDMISLGRGQGPRAEELIAKAQILKGRWIFLQNCHLAASWMPRLQAIVDGFNKPDADVDPQFRLWLSSKPDPQFPISILQNGLKMTVEPPKGVKANLQRSFGSAGTGAVTERLYQETFPDNRAWKKLLFGLCLFNAILHERKKYGCLGWNIPYEFNDSDLEVSVLQLEMLLSEQGAIPWPALWYLTGEVTYGGRVTDDNDRHCLHCLLQKFYHPRALENDYYYSDDKVYYPPDADMSFEDIKTYIDNLPALDSPELFGMNDNAEKACLESQANDLMDTILGVQPRIFKSLIGTHKSSDEMVLDMAEHIRKTLPEKAELDEEETSRNAQKRPTLSDIVSVGTGTYFKTQRKSAQREKGLIMEDNYTGIDQIKQICASVLFTVLRQEIDRFNVLLLVIHKSLKSLCRAVKGEIVMSLTLEEAYNAMLNQRVPAEWKAHAYESCKPLGAWIRDLTLRVEFFAEWCELVIKAADKAIKLQNQQQTADTLAEEGVVNLAKTQPRSFWLSSFFFPQGFLTAVLQNHARKIGVSVDSLHFNFLVQPDSSESEASLNNVKKKLDIKDKGFRGSSGPEDGVYVFGLYLDGAQWDLETMTLADSLPGNRFCRLTEIHFKPSTEASRPSTASTLESPLAMFKTRQPEDVPMRETFECPLYRTSTRAGTLSSTGHSTNFVTMVSMPTKKPSEFWVMRGVAMLCQLDD